MATRQYIGARYVPKFYTNSVDGSTQWEANVVYESLIYVTLQNGHIYISKKQVPATVGTPASNAKYWLDMGSYNGFIESLQNQINDIIDAEGNIIADAVLLTEKTDITGTHYSVNDANVSGNSNGYYELNNGAIKGVNYATASDAGLRIKGSSSVLENDIVNTGSQGVCAASTVDNLLISDNDITSVNYPVLVDQTGDGSGIIIDANFIKANNGDGVELNNPYGTFSDVVVSNNVIDAGSDGGTGHSAGVGIGMAKPINTTVVGNVSKHSRNEGLHIENGPKHLVVTGNVFDECNYGGVYLDQRFGSAVTDVGDIVIHSDNRYNGDGNEIGLQTIYNADNDDLVVYDNNNIYSNFNKGIVNIGRTSNENHRVFNDIITGCNIGIETRKDVHGELIIDNCDTSVLVYGDANRVMFNSLNVLRAPAYDHIITFTDNANNARCILKHFKISKTLTTASTSENMITAPKYAKGLIIVELQEPYKVFKVYEIEGTTLTQLDSEGYGTFTPSLSIADGILKCEINNSYTGAIMIDFTGVYVISS